MLWGLLLPYSLPPSCCQVLRTYVRLLGLLVCRHVFSHCSLEGQLNKKQDGSYSKQFPLCGQQDQIDPQEFPLTPGSRNAIGTQKDFLLFLCIRYLFVDVCTSPLSQLPMTLVLTRVQGGTAVLVTASLLEALVAGQSEACCLCCFPQKHR